MYTVIYKKKAGYYNQSFSTSHIYKTKLLNMLYNIIFTYKAK